MKQVRFAVLALALPLVLGGCAFGVTNVRVSHSPLSQPPQKRAGVILVKPFVDFREQDRAYIGTKRNGFGMALGHIGVRDGRRVDELLTEFFSDALRQAGYTVISKSSPSSGTPPAAILQGEIRKFWLDLYMAAWHDIDVRLSLYDRHGEGVVWEKDIAGRNSNVLWVGVASEFEKVIRQAIDDALNRAVLEFSSESFHSGTRAEVAP